MQYPIIDLITDAYINNGWTGLDFVSEKNLIGAEIGTSRTDHGVYYTVNEDGSITCIGTAVGTSWGFGDSYRITLNPGEYTFSVTGGNKMRTVLVNDNTGVPLFTITGSNYFTFNITENTLVHFYITISNGITVDETLYIQLENGNTVTPYEQYNPNSSTDFPNRLKLPLPHYFPHPVIDALQRAAAGTQTADDTEILRHYLTPLGIGGI